MSHLSRRTLGGAALAWLAAPRPGVTEIILHPVEDGPELAAYDKTESWIRTHDAKIGVDETVKAKLDAAGIKRMSFRGIREAMRHKQTVTQ